LNYAQEKLNEAIMTLNKNLQEINIANMDTELVSQMFKNYQSNVLFHLEGMFHGSETSAGRVLTFCQLPTV
jgi:hypothetical protein